jgi:small-conductance mechanosensitive channel
VDFIRTITPLIKEYRVFFVIIAAIILIRIITVKVYKRRKALKKRDNFITGINNVTTILGSIWLFFFLLHLLGITLREFFTSLTIIAAALAIVFRDYIVNGLNGMIIMFGDNLHIGDYVQVGEEKGIIQDISLLNVHLKNDEENLVIIPNNTFINSTIINLSRNPRHNIGIDFEIKTQATIEAVRLEKALMEVMTEEQKYIKPQTPEMRIVEIRKDLIHYRFRFGLVNYSREQEKRIKQKLWRVVLSMMDGNKKIQN